MGELLNVGYLTNYEIITSFYVNQFQHGYLKVTWTPHMCIFSDLLSITVVTAHYNKNVIKLKMFIVTSINE